AASHESPTGRTKKPRPLNSNDEGRKFFVGALPVVWLNPNGDLSPFEDHALREAFETLAVWHRLNPTPGQATIEHVLILGAKGAFQPRERQSKPENMAARHGRG
ncbi:unnamed protein product, partial [Amoebophrya sp. A25]